MELVVCYNLPRFSYCVIYTAAASIVPPSCSNMLLTYLTKYLGRYSDQPFSSGVGRRAEIIRGKKVSSVSRVFASVQVTNFANPCGGYNDQSHNCHHHDHRQRNPWRIWRVVGIKLARSHTIPRVSTWERDRPRGIRSVSRPQPAALAFQGFGRHD